MVAATPVSDRKDRKGDGKLKITNIYFEDKQGRKLQNFVSGQHVKVVAEYQSSTGSELNNVSVGFGVDNKDGVRIVLLWNELTGYFFQKIPGKGKFVCHIPKIPFVAGNYVFTVSSRVNGMMADWITNAANFFVDDGDYYNSGKKQSGGQGDILIEHSWTVEHD